MNQDVRENTVDEQIQIDELRNQLMRATRRINNLTSQLDGMVSTLDHAIAALATVERMTFDYPPLDEVRGGIILVRTMLLHEFNALPDREELPEVPF